MVSILTILSQRDSIAKYVLNSKIKLEPWMHIGIIELDNGTFGYAIWVWDSRQVIDEAELPKEHEDQIGVYITDHFITNEIRTNDNYLPLIGGGKISTAISKYFDEYYDNLINGIEASLNLSYEDAMNELPEKSDKVKLIKSIKHIFGNVSTHEQRCVSVDSFRDGIKIRCNGGHDVAVMVNSKKKAGLNANLPKNSRVITVYY